MTADGHAGHTGLVFVSSQGCHAHAPVSPVPKSAESKQANALNDVNTSGVVSVGLG